MENQVKNCIYLLHYVQLINKKLKLRQEILLQFNQHTFVCRNVGILPLELCTKY